MSQQCVAYPIAPSYTEVDCAPSVGLCAASTNQLHEWPTKKITVLGLFLRKEREGRFKSQALLDESAVLSAMAYVDLNPIRAQMANIPEASDFTSIQERIKLIKENQHVTCINALAVTPKHLQTFAGDACLNEPRGIPFRLEEYLQLVDWTGKILRDDKKGYIPENISPILERLKIDTKQWLYCTQHFESR
ncbi:MAG: hypothetical protein P8104_08320, partial [Gammaproteobacteria bacterium]